MSMYSYLLEVLIASVSLRKIPIQDPKDLKVEIESPLAKLTFTSSRLNLLTFCGDTTATFEADLETIKDDLVNNPLKVTVKLKEQVVAIGEIPWPKKFVDGIGENMEVITDGANTELKMDDKVVGCLEVIIRLQGCCDKCQLEEEENDLENVNNDIRSGDIIFLMDDGEGCKKKEPEAEEDPCKGRLNLANYRESNGKIVLSPEFHNACTSPQCITLKRMGGNLEKIVNSLVCSGVQDVRANKNPKCCSPCEMKWDPCTGQYVCVQPDPACCSAPKVSALCVLKSNQPTCSPQPCFPKSPCTSSPPCSLFTPSFSVPKPSCVSSPPCSRCTPQLCFPTPPCTSSPPCSGCNPPQLSVSTPPCTSSPPCSGCNPPQLSVSTPPCTSSPPCSGCNPPQLSVEKPSCAPSPSPSAPSPSSSVFKPKDIIPPPSNKSVSTQYTPIPKPKPVSTVGTCLMCMKHEYLPNKWPNSSKVDCSCKSITPKPPKISKCCRICQDLLEHCINADKKKPDHIKCKQKPVPPPKICRICKTDITWLPKNFDCPTCGDKQKSCLQDEYQKTLKMLRKLV